MLAIIVVFALMAIVALAVLSFALHLIFSPWLLLAIVAAVVWFRFRPRRSRR